MGKKLSTIRRTNPQGIAFDAIWSPTWDATYGLAASPAAAPITSRLTISGGQFQLGGSVFRIFSATAVESICALDDANERVKVPQRISARGYNFVRFLGFDFNLTPNGCWTTGYAGYDETYLSRMDETIANLNALGIYVWFSFNHYDQVRTHAGLAAGPQHFQGMMWDTTDYVPAYKAHLDVFLERVNTVTGVAYKDNPGIAVWEPDNENGFSDAFRDNAFDVVVSTPLEPWATRLHALINAWWNTNYGSNAPGSVFPTKAVYTTWGLTDRQRLWEFMMEKELDYVTDMYAYIKSYNSGILVCTNTFNYMDPRASYVGEVCTRHNYSQVASGSALSPPYTTRGTILADMNGWNWCYTAGSRDASHPLVINERGTYGLSRFDYEDPILEAVVQCLQEWSGFMTFCEGQNKFQSAVTGIQDLTHLQICWHSRQLAALCAAPIMRYGFIAALPNSRTYAIDPADFSTKAETQGNADLSGWRWTTGGSEWAFLQKKIYTDYTGPTSAPNDTAINDSDITAGVAVTSEVYWKSDGIKLTAAKVDGWCGNVTNGTAGTLTISGVTNYKGVCMIRSSGDYALYAGPALFFAHRHTTVYTSTDGDIGFTGTTDGESVSGWGTESNTRLVMPAAFQVAMTTASLKTVYGITKTGAIVDMVASYSGGATRFTTDPRCPLYYVH